MTTIGEFLITALKQLMLEKEAELALTNNELAELEEYQVIVCYAVTQQLIATDAWKTSCIK